MRQSTRWLIDGVGASSRQRWYGRRSGCRRFARTFPHALLGGLVALLCFMWMVGLRLNLTTSLPAGFYVTSHTPPERGSIVLACLPAQVAELARERGYVPRGGRCPGGLVPVGKIVAAIVGDTVTVTAEGLSINGILLVSSSPLERDRRQRPLPRIPHGRHLVAPGTLWLVGLSATSFDSRYFGPIAAASVVAPVRPLWTATQVGR